MYTDFRDQNQVFSGLLARFPTAMTIAWRGQSERVQGDLVSGNYFDVLGVRPALGRVFNAADDRIPGAHPDRRPQLRLLAAPLRLRSLGPQPDHHRQRPSDDHRRRQRPPGSAGCRSAPAADVMVPMMMKAQMTPTWNDLDNRRSRWLTVIGRLKPGMSREQAAAQMNVIYRQINEQEVKDINSPSASFKQRFVSKRLELLPGGRGLSDLRGAVLDAAHRADGDGRRRAADRVRQRREPDAGAHRRAAQGDRAAARARRRPRPHRPAAAGGERAARRSAARRSAWCWRRGPDRCCSGRCRAIRPAATLSAMPDAARAGLRAGPGAADRAGVRPRAGAPGRALPGERDAEGGGRQRRRAAAGRRGSAARWSSVRWRCRCCCWPAPACSPAASTT